MPSTRTHLRAGAVAASAALVVTLAACSSSGTDEESGSTLEQLQNDGKITVAIADERPYSWVEGGEPTGATIAMHREIFSNMGIDDVEVVEVDWNSLIPGLKAGRFDAISAGMSILPERCEEAAFSDPEIMYTTTLMVPEGNPRGLTDLDSVVDDPEVTLAVLGGGIESGYAEKLGISNTVSVDNAQSGMDLVANGRADAFAMTAISLNWMADNNPDAGVETTEAFVQEIDGVPQIGAGSTVFRTGDTELLDAYNEQLASITGDEQAYLDLVGEYGFTAENLPPSDLTTAQLCAGELG
ncbi:MAG: ectoine/hydroxyectoine ABC transporter substrate-binding protein EhuB [Actinobacteria bacterium HGW-Actinobacteria-11]|uniref:ectoine/hydroxyectoine ABC transporter substrate-binding protein EhuB n=1 Tax=Microbacterium sp. CBA3102 TaxID=2603598 RepID=UPI000CAC1A98|nr:ectoine/hydroxyectoine ABC transporter substrate-binding protein EhuB [Microbacterium sp. CBA3102]PKQ36253.1 MAG: ectoine/hydroxyectoine ABC transporter substrate-binding protein EhuB [Actinobacteria bacterium HGW-Actinobacteria-11]QEA28176.1 ectoine/hydroxyectoine ABC transporter substrate-binding protein EhuB [Microbacterium sp. CBA3102]